jgi:hypothetical protein
MPYVFKLRSKALTDPNNVDADRIVGVTEKTIMANIIKSVNVVDWNVPHTVAKKKLADTNAKFKKSNVPNIDAKLTLSNACTFGKSEAVMAPARELTVARTVKAKSQDAQCTDVFTAFNIPHRLDWSSSRKIRNAEMLAKVGPRLRSHT